MRLEFLIQLLRRLFKLAYAAPFAIGPALAVVKLTGLPLQSLFQRFSYFFLVSAFWGAMLYYIKNFYAPSREGKPSSKLRDAATITALLLLGAGFLGSLDLFRRRLPDSVFYLLILGISASALSETARQKHFQMASVFFKYFWYAAMAYLSFTLVSLAWRWEPVIVSCGLAFTLTASGLADWFLNRTMARPGLGSPLDRKTAVAGRLIAVFMLAGPVSIASLVYLGALESNFLAVFLILPLIIRVSPFRKKELAEERLNRDLLWKTEGVAFSFLVIVFLVAVAQHYM